MSAASNPNIREKLESLTKMNYSESSPLKALPEPIGTLSFSAEYI